MNEFNFPMYNILILTSTQHFKLNEKSNYCAAMSGIYMNDNKSNT